MDHDLNLEEMLAGGNMEDIVAEENMEAVGLDNSKEVEVEEDESESEEEVDSEGQEEEGIEVIAKKKKLTASVWFATKKLDAEKALCLLCKLVYSFGDGSPSNVRNHVIKRHSW